MRRDFSTSPEQIRLFAKARAGTESRGPGWSTGAKSRPTAGFAPPSAAAAGLLDITGALSITARTDAIDAISDDPLFPLTMLLLS
ncbi:hypothetical protein GCM10010197_15820 [Nocardioides luteus]|uniref:Uncharacterized protein n=1 Tax=Nocardioides luteus TaxID=1844 RepID=A0ABQ5SV90_9ACTN|nr:hypothetical protein GCM10010197_15820 [Nocardioides luteus]GLJ67766.1 hypothetical protein GCM10017579_18020 [Nocardioides luteus]